jgi:imidazolonepropionase-like amidohydrolase
MISLDPRGSPSPSSSPTFYIMEKDHQEGLPTYTDAVRPWNNSRQKRRTFRFIAIAILTYFAFSTYKIANNTRKPATTLSIEKLRDDHTTCATLRRVPTIEARASRSINKRWLSGTKPLLIRNATIWTGEPVAGTSKEDAHLGKGYSWISSDLFVDRGLIQKIGVDISLSHLPKDTAIYEAHGRQLTAGIVDMHSHAGLGSVGNLQDDVNELSADITPYVKSIDGLDPLQPEFQFIKSGGVTTSLILPGSGNNMGGEAFVVKMAVGKENGREEVSQQDMIADPDRNWRYMKMACGENPKGVYGKYGERGPFSRLGEAWEFRHALEQARDYVQDQDEWCAAADSVGAENMARYLPQELEWESLGAVLRGQVRVNTHCYTIPDLESFVRHTNEFKFRLYAFHHAHQTYLVPEVLKRTWGGTPAAALFADNSRSTNFDTSAIFVRRDTDKAYSVLQSRRLQSIRESRQDPLRKRHHANLRE